MIFIYPRQNFYFYVKIDVASCLFENNLHISHCEGDGKSIATTVTCLSNIIEKTKLRNNLLRLGIAKFRSENGDKFKYDYSI